MRPTRRLLLVGEGNFSFSASLCDASDHETRITATCYESEESVSRQALAKTNIQHLRGKGVEVCFCVDCTKLKDYFLPAKRNFDCIYFNFPHCGRKAGVTKNRELLMKFFCSCADVLAEKGEVHVALCKGQGGTPADQPMREWHNSWQVVAMAAGAGFILSDVHPFNVEDVHGYKCTGYRSQDKSFSVEGALNHIFTRGLPFPHPRSVICQTELEGKRVSLQVPEIFVDKINRGFLDTNSDHPVRTIHEKLIIQLCQTFLLQRVDHSLSLLHQGHLSAVSQSNAFCIIPNTEQNPSSEPIVNSTGEEAKSSETIELNDSVRPDPQLDKTQYFICVKTETSASKANGSCIGAISAAPCGLINSELGIVFASVNLDLLAMQICGISDWRMLWTLDKRFLNQFIGGELRPFKSFSLHPPSYVHDVSFWIPEWEQFDEVAFHTIARCVSQETVVSIQLLDSFQHPQTGQTSLCYRLTFQSCDKALTRQQVAEMQMQFRKELQQCLHLTLR
ncbi:histone H2A.x-like [Platysternon megacephalum]|uniref:phenylalanine--tRNA ligase n=1 Tax=Platysternon megacephalum TaxID=55544 RepID=A0A4D9DNW7_9SAUR|nr:histone H2A.x-like [Platysternon megacephalum]